MWSVVGHDKVVATLARRLEAGQMSHAYLFDGPVGVGKMRLALNIAQALNCVEDGKPCGSCGQCHRIAGGKHADVQIIGVLHDAEGPVRKVITIEQIKEFQQAAGLQPYEGVHRVFIIDGAEHLSQDRAMCGRAHRRFGSTACCQTNVAWPGLLTPRSARTSLGRMTPNELPIAVRRSVLGVSREVMGVARGFRRSTRPD